MYHKKLFHFLIPIELFLELRVKDQELKIPLQACRFSFSREIFTGIWDFWRQWNLGLLYVILNNHSKHASLSY